MTDPLAPQPMTADEIRSLVERARTAGEAAHAAGCAALSLALRGRPAGVETPKLEAAARYAYERHLTLAAAARRHRVNGHSIWAVFKRLYPGVPRRLSARSKP